MEFLYNPNGDILISLHGRNREEDLVDQNEIINIFNLLDSRTLPESYPDSFEYRWSQLPKNYGRDRYTVNYGFSLVSMDWLRILKEKVIKDSKCLEIMAGSGMISKGLRDLGTDIIATDNYSWRGGKSKFFENTWTDVINLNADDAIVKYGKDVDFIIMSWPYMNEDAYNALILMRKMNPNCIMIYIGEDYGGCTADDKFFETLEPVESLNDVGDMISSCYKRWCGIHDFLYFIK